MRLTVRLLLPALALLLWVAPAWARPDQGGNLPPPEPEPPRQEYRAARAAAIGLTACGFLMGVAGMGMNAQRPEAYLRSRKLATLCAVLFVLVVADRIVARGLAGWFQIPDPYLPPWWR